MGKGDIKTRRGKICRGSYGITRKRKNEKLVVVKEKITVKEDVLDVALEEKKVVTKKATAKKVAVKKEKETSKKTKTKKD